MKLWLLAFVFPSLAFATLGEGRSSIERDEQIMGGARILGQTNMILQGVQVYTSKVNEVTIRQFVDENNFVFAIAWSGLTYPNLTSLLGQFYTEYSVADALTLKGRRFPRQPVESKNFVLRRAGHFPHLHGYIYLKNKFPAGWSERSLQ